MHGACEQLYDVAELNPLHGLVTCLRVSALNQPRQLSLYVGPAPIYALRAVVIMLLDSHITHALRLAVRFTPRCLRALYQFIQLQHGLLPRRLSRVHARNATKQ